MNHWTQTAFLRRLGLGILRWHPLLEEMRWHFGYKEIQWGLVNAQIEEMYNDYGGG
jgi:hypothetical protein